MQSLTRCTSILKYTQISMYYSYKSKRKRKKIFRFLLIILAIAGLYYLGSKYKNYIFFWKYNYNKIYSKLEKISGIDNYKTKIVELQEISRICDDYNTKNQVSAESFLLAGKVHYQIAELNLNKTFSEIIINGYQDFVNDDKIISEFLKAVRNIRKGIALSGYDDLTPEYRLILAKSYFYTGYYNTDVIFSLTKDNNLKEISNTDDIRFLSLINIYNNNKDYGLEILKKYGMVTDNIRGKFFLACAYNLAGKYTDSIMCFKDILGSSRDAKLIKLANINLGRIYFNQSLFKESLYHFTSALKEDGKDNLLKIWIGKNYSALGEKTKARAIWTEVLANDNTNKEAKKLLGLM